MKIFGISFILMDCGSWLGIGAKFFGKRRAIMIPMPWQMPVPYKLKVWWRKRSIMKKSKRRPDGT